MAKTIPKTNLLPRQPIQIEFINADIYNLKAKSAREQHLKATQIEKEKISKVKADLEAKVTEIESGLKAAQNERVAAERSLEKCQKELQKSLEANQQLNAQLKTEKVDQDIISSSWGFFPSRKSKLIT